MHPNTKTSKELALHAIRWCNNILAEVNQNHVGPNFPQARVHLVDAMIRLEEAQNHLTKNM